MTAETLAAIADVVASTTKEFVAKSLVGMAERVAVLEKGLSAPKDGESAYQIAVKHGFVGDERAWSLALHGKEGQPGQSGKDGSSILTGVGQPTAEGRSGDVYLDVKSGDIYQWR